ncbi:hypothetical protein ACFL2L_01020, partial [Patescibacteria group bacterium]
MKKFKIISLVVVLFLFSFITAKAFDVNNKLIKVWNNRPDLQKAFPNPYLEDNKNLKDWAEKYGWKENNSLFEFSPYFSIINNIIDEKLKSITNANTKEPVEKMVVETDNTYLEELEKRIIELEKAKLMHDKGITDNRTDITESLVMHGKWTKVCIDVKGVVSFAKQEDTGIKSKRKND